MKPFLIGASGNLTSPLVTSGIKFISEVSCSRPLLTMISSSEFWRVVSDIWGESRFLGTEISIESHSTLPEWSDLSTDSYWVGIFLSSFGVYWDSRTSYSLAASSSAMIVYVIESLVGMDNGIDSIIFCCSSSNALTSAIIRLERRNWLCCEELYCFEISTAVVLDAKLCFWEFYLGQSNGLSSFIMSWTLLACFTS